MSDDSRSKARDIIDKDKWWDVLSRFMDVLRVNLFLIDEKGRMILPPEESRFGGRLLLGDQSSFGLLRDSANILDQFEPQGKYLEAEGIFGMHLFAIPIEVSDSGIVAYMIVGPIILNKRLDSNEYRDLARDRQFDEDFLLDLIQEVRVVSNLMVNSILDLLAEIVQDNVELRVKERELDMIKLDQEASDISKAEKVTDVAREIYSTVHQDELLGTLLDLALRITGTECGSIMILDEENDKLVIKVSRGLDESKVPKIQVKMGEGVAGISAAENEPFLIDGQSGDNRISKYLKRPEIKQALVLPLSARDKVFGVLNLHTKNDQCQLKENLGNLQHLSKLMSSAF